MADGGLKAVLKGAVKSSVSTAGYVLPPMEGARILTYHSVGERDHEMNVKPSDFTEQMTWLASNAAVISLEDVLEGRPGVAITFDDGYRDNLTTAAPVLTRLGLPATVFMVTGFAGRMLAHDQDRETSTLMTWDELRALDEMGIAIGAHTVNHRRLTELSCDEQRSEIVGSVEQLRQELGKAVQTFAYPFGTGWDYNANCEALVKESGCTLAVSNRYGVNPMPCERWALRRIWVDRTDTLAMFAAKVTGRLDGLAALEWKPALAMRRWLNGRKASYR